MVLKTKGRPEEITVLDPHFGVRGEVVARFRPTEDGWIDALTYCASCTPLR